MVKHAHLTPALHDEVCQVCSPIMSIPVLNVQGTRSGFGARMAGQVPRLQGWFAYSICPSLTSSREERRSSRQSLEHLQRSIRHHDLFDNFESRPIFTLPNPPSRALRGQVKHNHRPNPLNGTRYNQDQDMDMEPYLRLKSLCQHLSSFQILLSP